MHPVIPNPIIICVAIALHLTWALSIYMDVAAINATAPHALLIIAQSPRIAAAVFGAVGGLAIAGLFAPRRWLCMLLLLPQHVVLWISAVGAMGAMALGQFADGVQRSHWFLISDQSYIVIIAIGHAAALYALTRHDGEQRALPGP